MYICTSNRKCKRSLIKVEKLFLYENLRSLLFIPLKAIGYSNLMFL